MLQSSLECYSNKQSLSQDTQLNTVQMALEAEKGKSAMMQVSIDASSLECFNKNASQDTQLNTVQMALEAEKGKSAMMQVSIDAKDSEIARLKNELCERMEDIGRLTSHLAAKRDELREKDETMRLLHNTVVDLKV
ncbi:hypothetical protein COOONC_17522 [Cooperia oncophora]